MNAAQEAKFEDVRGSVWNIFLFDFWVGFLNINVGNISSIECITYQTAL